MANDVGRGRRLSRRRALMAGAAAGAGAVLAACRAGAGEGTPAPAATPALLEMVSREAWGSAAPDHTARAERGLFDARTNPGGWLVYAAPLRDVLNTLVVHHSALPLSDGPLEIQRLHMERRGFADIGYHFVIGALGQIYAGRDLAVRGAHVGGANTGTVGAALLGNFEREQPAEAQLESLRRLGAYLADAYALTHLAGHQDFQPGVTLCPGHELAPLLPGLAGELELEYGTGGFVRPPWSR
jgi:hypothetical protein